MNKDRIDLGPNWMYSSVSDSQDQSDQARTDQRHEVVAYPFMYMQIRLIQ